MKRLHRLAGRTLIEVVVSAGLSAMVMGVSVAVFMFGMKSWYTGQGRIEAEGTSHQVLRTLSAELREAMALTVDADGQGVTYQLPTKDGSGNYIVPITTDGVSRRVSLTSGNIVMTAGANTRIACRNIWATDPATNAAYKVFTAGTGSVVRQLSIIVATRRPGSSADMVTSRSAETIFLRNVPELYQ